MGASLEGGGGARNPPSAVISEAAKPLSGTRPALRLSPPSFAALRLELLGSGQALRAFRNDGEENQGVSGSSSQRFTVSSNQPSDRSRHSGFSASIAASFQRRFHPFIRVSISIAGSIV